MGTKDSEYSNQVGEVAERAVDLFQTLGQVTWRKMFGGVGIFIEDSMFALVDSAGRLHLKVDDSNKDRFVEADASKHTRMPYYSVPDFVLDDDRELLDWASESASIART